MAGMLCHICFVLQSLKAKHLPKYAEQTELLSPPKELAVAAGLTCEGKDARHE